MRKGLFLTFEGLDGCGKSTQAQLLVGYLKERGYKVLLTREPGGTTLAEEIRRVILTPSDEPLVPMAEILLYAASRAQHVENLIKPALADGKIVICDRFVDSSIAYQGYGLGWDPELIKQVNGLVVGDCMPDLTFFIDVDTEQALGRVQKRNDPQSGGDRIESREFLFHKRVRDGFLKLAEYNERIIPITSDDKSIEELHNLLVGYVQNRLNLFKMQ